MVPQRRSRFVAHKEVAVKKYVVRLSDEEREQSIALIHSGKHAARKLLKARILLKADASEAGEGWSDSQIAEALHTSLDTVARTRQRLVEEGFEAALAYQYSPTSARPRIFDGEEEARLITLACSKPPAGHAVDAAPAGREGRGTRDRRQRQRQHDRADAKKNLLKPHLKQWVIPPDDQRRVRGRDGRRAGGVSQAA